MSHFIPDKLLTRQEVAEIFGISAATLAVWACNQSQDLPFIKIGRCVRYRMQDVQTFIETQMQGGEV